MEPGANSPAPRSKASCSSDGHKAGLNAGLVRMPHRYVEEPFPRRSRFLDLDSRGQVCAEHPKCASMRKGVRTAADLDGFVAVAAAPVIAAYLAPGEFD